MSWYNTGGEGLAKEDQRLAALSGPRRVWVPAGETKQLVLLDDELFEIYEHNAKINNSWQNHHTCCGAADGCESCKILGPRSKAYTAYLTCVDCSRYVDKKGNSHQYEVKLVGAKSRGAKLWKMKRERRGSLIGRWNVQRIDQKAQASGDQWDFEDEIKDHAKLFELANYHGKHLAELWDKADADAEARNLLGQTFQLEYGEDGKLVRRVPPFNYMELLKPKPPAFLREMLSGAAPAEESAPTGAGEDDVPF